MHKNCAFSIISDWLTLFPGKFCWSTWYLNFLQIDMNVIDSLALDFLFNKLSSENAVWSTWGSAFFHVENQTSSLFKSGDGFRKFLVSNICTVCGYKSG